MEEETVHLEHHDQHSIQRLGRWGQTSEFCQMSRLPLAPAAYFRFSFVPISSLYLSLLCCVKPALTRTMATWSKICTHLLSCQHLQEVPCVYSFTSVVLQCSIILQFTAYSCPFSQLRCQRVPQGKDIPEVLPCRHLDH